MAALTDFLSRATELLQSLTPFEAACATAALLLTLLALLLLILRPPDAYLAYTNGNGRVLVTRRSLHQVIRHSCEGVAGVVRADVDLRRRRGKLAVGVRLKLRPGAKLESISGYLQQQIEEALKTNLGIEDLDRVDITVVGFIPVEQPKERTTQIERA